VFLESGGFGLINPGANPTIVSYIASPVKIYNATSSLARFEINFYKVKNALTYYSAGVAVVNSEVVGLAPGLTDPDVSSFTVPRCLLQNIYKLI
jgi:hypothetical protein